MKYYSKIPRSERLWIDWIASSINRIIFWVARRIALSESKAHGGMRYYVLDVFDSYMIVSSREKRDIDMKMPKGKKMNFAELMRSQVYITPHT